MKDKKTITDQEMDSYLEGNTPLSEIYSKGKDVKAPEHLDSLVKTMAREAEQERFGENNLPIKKKEWFIPASIAASVVAAITITFVFNFQDTDKNTQIAIKDKNKVEPVQPQRVTKKQPDSTQQKEVLATTEIKQTPPTTSEPAQVTNKKIAEKVAKDTNDFVLPAELNELILNTNASGTNKVEADEILKNWSKEQWKQRVQSLQEANNTELAKKYINKYPNFFPGETLLLDKK